MAMLAEGTAARVAYKAYSTGVISSNSQAVSMSDPGPSGGQILRRVAATLKLGKDPYQSAEIRTDRQTADFRGGSDQQDRERLHDGRGRQFGVDADAHRWRPGQRRIPRRRHHPHDRPVG